MNSQLHSQSQQSSPPTILKTGGIVLCGGRSSRMGRPKAWLPFAGEPMLARVVRILGEVVSPVVVVAAPDQDVPPLPSEVEIIRDAADGRGPLQGLVGGLDALAGRVEAVYLSACDVPFLIPNFVGRLVELLGDHDACVPEIDGYRHPLAAVYRVRVRAAASQLLAAGQGRARSLAEGARTRFVGPPELADIDPKFQSLRNLNTLAEYEAAVQVLGRG